MITQTRTRQTTGLMLSGGLDSAILLGELLAQGRRVQPFYVSTGCVWEADERRAVGQFLEMLNDSAVSPVVDLAMPVGDLYGRHWSVTGRNVPDESTADEAVCLPGRNPLLLLKPLLWCGQHGISNLALATLAANPFADATTNFFQQFTQALATATEASVAVVHPFAERSKAEILALDFDLPLHLTFSCLAPHNGQHCGTCNKCAERKSALQSIAGGDPTEYAAVNAAF